MYLSITLWVRCYKSLMPNLGYEVKRFWEMKLRLHGSWFLFLSLKFLPISSKSVSLMNGFGFKLYFNMYLQVILLVKSDNMWEVQNTLKYV